MLKVRVLTFVSKVNGGRIKKFFCLDVSIHIGAKIINFAVVVWVNALNSCTFVSSHNVNAL